MTSCRCHDDFDVIITLAITNVLRLSDIKLYLCWEVLALKNPVKPP